MACCPDGKSYRRINAIHLLLIGGMNTTIANPAKNNAIAHVPPH